ncbi:Probable lipoprotein precursor [Tenacibaculum maritimum]|uniref:hypothetical protein n=1 Tax=Tenacibaculum maritimum TaxID=107401 RepID=UPI0012E6BC02|nr:hypothetical protein [Tenacibaculum maritimum]CAA0148961.1 Probable lipoprotein precursor [Tenacibaculum maritimum]CAA0151601.1 Probable lipoprotein precursor [Tenacibaculum maritimum]CAA0151773.1 Probable lipoprotein precursor [Tenacibaculum maritimum]
MKKLLKPLSIVAFIASSLIFTSCTDDGNEIFKDIDDNTDKNYEIIVNPTNAASEERSIDIVAQAGSTVKVKVSFTGDKKMRRIYMTKNVFSSHQGPQPYEYPLGSKKSDGSIDLDGDDKDSFNFTFDFDTPSRADDVVQYVIWTTNDRGDFRDISKRNSIAEDAYGTITIKAGNGAQASGFTSFTQTILAAPLADGTSKTFLSLFNEEVYKINDGTETLALWDFGYFYGNTTGASFYSVADFPKVFKKDGAEGLHISEFVGADLAELNKFYFKISTADFDAVASGADLDFIEQPASQRIQRLEVGDVVEFVDQYGNKGLIKVVAINAGAGSAGKITFDVKVQVNAIPVKQ